MGDAGQLIRSDTLSFRAFGLAWLPDGHLAVGGISGSDFDHGVLTVMPGGPGPARWTRGDVEPVNHLAASPDGQWLAVAGWRSAVVSTEDGEVRFPAFDQFRGEVAGFSPDGSLVAWSAWVIGRGSPHVTVVDAQTGTIRLNHGDLQTLQWAFSPDSRRIAIAGSNAVDVVDIDTGGKVRLPLASEPASLAYSPDGQWLAAGCADGTVQILATATSQPAQTVPVHETTVRSMTFSPDGRWVAATVDVGVGVFGVDDGTPLLPELPILPVGIVVFSPDLRYLAVVRPNSDGLPEVAVLGAATGATIWRATIVDNFPSRVEFSADGRRLALCGSNDHETGVVNIYDTGVDVSRHEHDAAVTALTMSPAGTPLVAFADGSPAVTVLAAETGTRLARKPVPGTLADLAFADGGQSVAVAGSAGVRLFSILGDRSWKLESIGTVNAIAVGGPAGEWVATAAGRTARVLSTEDGAEHWASPNTHPQTVTRVAMSRDGRWVATGCADRRTRLLDATTSAEVFGTAADGKIFDVAFGPLGTLLATANEDGSVVVVDTAAVAERARISRSFACSLVAFNHDETLLATAWDDNTVSIHDLTAAGSAPELRRLSYANPVTTLAFDPAGPALCVATGTPTAVLVDPQSGLDLRWLPHSKPVRHVAFSADGRLIATASDDDVVRVVSSVDIPE
ncbi:WD40 repeat domain-containing protein [Actinophytocola sp.]|uniref:WD40 repeat domain-containing protein n=1 Tax=Actinophytocola sp. TaxID=1872138 RepID=UPI003D6C1267